MNVDILQNCVKFYVIWLFSCFTSIFLHHFSQDGDQIKCNGTESEMFGRQSGVDDKVDRLISIDIFGRKNLNNAYVNSVP